MQNKKVKKKIIEENTKKFILQLKVTKLVLHTLVQNLQNLIMNSKLQVLGYLPVLYSIVYLIIPFQEIRDLNKKHKFIVQ